MSNADRDYYCNMKFKYIKVDLESQMTYTCHAAKPHKVDFDWLDKNPGQIFNTDINVLERQKMLHNERNSSCEQNCWPAEDVGAKSPRLYQQGFIKTHTQTITTPEIIDLTINTDCNLTCSYCCKEYSTAWSRDLINNGDYDISQSDFRFKISDKDKILIKIGQKKVKSTKHYQVLFQQIKDCANGLKKLIITGGEPLLDNTLIRSIIDLDLPDTTVIEIYTGLGLSHSRFIKLLDDMKNLTNLQLIISAEGIGKHLEFNRYGNTWADVDKKIKYIKDSGIRFHFQSQLSNLTIFGFAEFAKYFSNHDIVPTFVYQPIMMAPYVMDTDSKQQIIDSIKDLPDSVKHSIKKTILPEPTELQRTNIAEFLTQFVSRRPDLDLEIFPKTFVNWLGLSHVV
jgi:organic radical activating enzyme